MRSSIKTIFTITGLIIFSAFIIKEKQPGSPSAPGLKIVKTWNLPVVLKEISGIAVMDSVRLACIQDEVGSIFIYNTATSGIQEVIPFATTGDYEGIAIVDNTFWVLRSDGKLFEVSTLDAKKTTVKE